MWTRCPECVRRFSRCQPPNCRPARSPSARRREERRGATRGRNKRLRRPQSSLHGRPRGLAVHLGCLWGYVGRWDEMYNECAPLTVTQADAASARGQPNVPRCSRCCTPVFDLGLLTWAPMSVVNAAAIGVRACRCLRPLEAPGREPNTVRARLVAPSWPPSLPPSGLSQLAR